MVLGKINSSRPSYGYILMVIICNWNWLHLTYFFKWVKLIINIVILFIYMSFWTIKLVALWSSCGSSKKVLFEPSWTFLLWPTQFLGQIQTEKWFRFDVRVSLNNTVHLLWPIKLTHILTVMLYLGSVWQRIKLKNLLEPQADNLKMFEVDGARHCAVLKVLASWSMSDSVRLVYRSGWSLKKLSEEQVVDVSNS